MVTHPSPERSRVWLLWLGIATLLSVVVALVVALIKVRARDDAADAILSAGAAFATTFGLCLAVPAAVRELKGLGD
ncbi:hypothetical protein QZH56_16475 [Streptomyces olivoreticuli]|uniref:hypothetical protein n=1 Tax=Streptomyces olivoreticuli TaxID=68246 RepID=UPI001892AECB|nr:hypothetical protein [Streptomyces olivoreticuli]WKK27042.1 hypothetical protein QZH56_16475 [Streptomyces olivoreticuli]